jgi:hypothetical protein
MVHALGIPNIHDEAFAFAIQLVEWHDTAYPDRGQLMHTTTHKPPLEVSRSSATAATGRSRSRPNRRPRCNSPSFPGAVAAY